MTTEDKQKKSDILQGWIRTLWPILLTSAVIIMGYTNLEARVQVLELTVQQMQECISNLENGQNETNITLGIIQTNMANMDSNLGRIVNIMDGER